MKWLCCWWRFSESEQNEDSAERANLLNNKYELHILAKSTTWTTTEGQGLGGGRNATANGAGMIIRITVISFKLISTLYTSENIIGYYQPNGGEWASHCEYIANSWCQWGNTCTLPEPMLHFSQRHIKNLKWRLSYTWWKRLCHLRELSIKPNSKEDWEGCSPKFIAPCFINISRECFNPKDYKDLHFAIWNLWNKLVAVNL